MGIFGRKIHLIILLTLIFFNQNVSLIYGQEQKEYPKTYEEAVKKVIDILDNNTKILIQNSPRFNLSAFRYLIHENKLIDYKNYDFLVSCAKSIGVDSVHFEEVTYVVLLGVWEQLNSDLDIVDFDKVEPENYFDKIQETIDNHRNDKRLGYLSSLPSWIFHQNQYDFIELTSREEKLLQVAKKLVMEKKKNSYLGLLFMTQFNPNLEEKKEIIESYYKNKNDYFEIPSYSFTIHKQKSSSKQKEKIIDIKYSFKKTQFKELALKCFEIIYDKKFSSYKDYEKFINYCNSNYFAKWKYLKILAKDDYELLINEPRKLLEILILTDKYYYKKSSTHDLIIHSNENIDDLIFLIESKDSISLRYPYQKRLERHNYKEIDSSYKSVNALKIIAERLSIEELFDIMNPESIKKYNKLYKTNDLLDYKYFTSFIIASQYERVLKHPDKSKTFNYCKYYWENEHVSWPYKYFLTDMLIQIERQKAIEFFMKEFKDNPTSGSFTRQGILSSIIEYDFENNSKFIEEWYWIIQDKKFNHSPVEHELILNLLKNKNSKTLELYNKIEKDYRFRG